MKLNRLTLSLAAALALMAVGTGNVFAQADALVETLQKKGLLTQREANEIKEKMFGDVREQFPGTKMKIGGWLDELKIYGDARVRYEQFWNRRVAGTLTGVNEEQDRTRYRLRLRLGMEARAKEWTAGLRLASGDTSGPLADAISTNTTFDNYGSKKNINIDMAYLSFEPDFINGLKLTGGKFENPFWESDMVYDSDLTPEGFAEQYKHKFMDEFSVFANVSQWVLTENNTATGSPSGPADGSIRGKDAYMFGYQAGYEWKVVPKKIELKQALAFYDYEGLNNEDRTVGGASVPTSAVIRNSTAALFGNTVLEDHFHVLSINNEVRLGYWEKYPVRLQGEFISNLGGNSLLSGNDAYLNEGWKVGGILGEAKKKGQWQFGYWYEFLGANATLSNFSDSDFGNGGTNNKGHIIKATYMLTDWASLGLSYWNVTAIKDVVNSGALGTQVNQNAANTERFQFDVAMKF